MDKNSENEVFMFYVAENHCNRKIPTENKTSWEKKN